MFKRIPTIRIMYKRRYPDGTYHDEIAEDVVEARVYREYADRPHIEILNDGNIYKPLPLPGGKI